MNTEVPTPRKPWYLEPTRIALVAFLGIGGYFLVTEHWAHVVPWLPWLFLAACPLLHIFMHGGHGGHGGHGSHQGHSNHGRRDGQEGTESKDRIVSAEVSPKEPGEHEHHHESQGGRRS